MKLLELTLDEPAENISLDEALLETAETSEDHPEVLRIWEPQSPMVVIGRSSPIETEVNLDFCDRNGIEVYRRASGGQSIATGPGCLMYAVLLDYQKRPELRILEEAHRFVTGQMQLALKTLQIETQMEGTCDLTLDGKKFSGNALRCKRNWLIYHGTMLCNFDIDLIAKCLGKPIRQPEYRGERDHREFITQLPTSTNALANAIKQQWPCSEALETWPKELTQQLVEEKYSQQKWNNKI